MLSAASLSNLDPITERELRCLQGLLCVCWECCVFAGSVVCLQGALYVCTECCVFVGSVVCLQGVLCVFRECCVFARCVVCLQGVLYVCRSILCLKECYVYREDCMFAGALFTATQTPQRPELLCFDAFYNKHEFQAYCFIQLACKQCLSKRRQLYYNINQFSQMTHRTK